MCVWPFIWKTYWKSVIHINVFWVEWISFYIFLRGNGCVDRRGMPKLWTCTHAVRKRLLPDTEEQGESDTWLQRGCWSLRWLWAAVTWVETGAACSRVPALSVGLGSQLCPAHGVADGTPASSWRASLRPPLKKGFTEVSESLTLLPFLWLSFISKLFRGSWPQNCFSLARSAGAEETGP